MQTYKQFQLSQPGCDKMIQLIYSLSTEKRKGGVLNYLKSAEAKSLASRFPNKYGKLLIFLDLDKEENKDKDLIRYGIIGFFEDLLLKHGRKLREYIVLEDGKIYSKRHKHFLSFTGGHSYPKTMVRENGESKNKYFHRIVAEAYYGNSDLTVDHIDSNPVNCRPDNLRYLTAKENNERPKSYIPTKFTKEQIEEILNLKKIGYGVDYIRKVFNCRYSRIAEIIRVS